MNLGRNCQNVMDNMRKCQNAHSTKEFDVFSDPELYGGGFCVRVRICERCCKEHGIVWEGGKKYEEFLPEPK